MRTSIPRLLFSISIAVLWCLAATAATSIMGWAGPTLGWLWAGFAFLPGLTVAALVWGGPLLTARLTVGTALALVLGLACWLTMPPSHGHLRDIAADVALPDGWTVVDSHDYGDGWCMEGCPYLELDYAVTGGTSYDEAGDDLVDALHDQGWSGDADRLSRGRWQIELAKPFVEPAATIRATYSAP